MRRHCVLMALTVALTTACSGGRQAVRQQVRSEQVRVDSLAAVMAEDLHVSFHDVVIAPVDSPRLRVYVKEVELTRDREARIETRTDTCARTEAASEQTPAPGASAGRRLSFALGALLGALCVAALMRRRR